MQVSGPTSENVVTLNTCEYLGVLLPRGAGVVQSRLPIQADLLTGPLIRGS